MKAKEKYTQLVYKTLDIPPPETWSDIENNGGRKTQITIGRTVPASVKGAVVKITNTRLDQVEKLLKRDDLHYENYRYIEKENFQSFAEFKEFYKKADLSNYLNYLKNKVPKLFEFLTQEQIIVRLPIPDFWKHVYITGGTGSGKSEIIRHLIYSGFLLFHQNYKASVVVIDPHGDLIKRILQTSLLQISDELVLIDPHLKEGYTPTLNPFDIKDKSETNIDIVTQELVGVFKELLRGKSELTLQMETLLSPCIATLLRIGGRSLIDLQNFMHKDTNKDLVKRGLESPNEAHRHFFKTAFEWSNYEITKRSIFTKIQSLLNFSTFSNLITGPNTIDLEEILSKGKFVLFNLSKGELGEIASEAYGRFLIASLQALAIKRAKLPESERIPVHLFIDECQNYISPTMNKILTESRKYGLHLILAQQRIGQMPANLKDEILSNTQIKITGINGENTYSAIAKNTDLEKEELERLRKYHFFVSNKGHPSFKSEPIKIPKEDEIAEDPEFFERICTAQVENYYRPTKKQPVEAVKEAGENKRKYDPQNLPKDW